MDPLVNISDKVTHDLPYPHLKQRCFNDILILQSFVIVRQIFLNKAYKILEYN